MGNLKVCIGKVPDLDVLDREVLLDSLSDGKTGEQALADLETSVKAEQTALIKSVEDSGGKVVKDGRDFRDFFTSITEGNAGIPTLSADFKPVVTAVREALADSSSELYEYNKIYNSHKGNFDNHIALSIPGYREFQFQIGIAIGKTFDSGTMLDMGASEGTQAKTITERSGGKIKTVSMDPAPAMERTFNSTSDVPGATFSLTALSMDPKDDGKFAWNDKDGTPIHWFNPVGKYDIIQEAMVFQFIDNNRADHIKRTADMLAPKGLAIFQEKLHNDNWDQNEIDKNKFKALSFEKEAMSQKAAEVLEGMNKNMVRQEVLEQELANNFKYFVQIWDSGNFKGYAASNDLETLAKFKSNMGGRQLSVRNY